MTAHPYTRLFSGKTTAPTVDDDSDAGYEVGDIWIDETNNVIYQAVDVTMGAAVWAGLAYTDEQAQDAIADILLDTATIEWAYVVGVSIAASVKDNSLSNFKLANAAGNSIKGNTSAASATPEDVAVGANQFLARSSSGNLAAKTISDPGLAIVKIAHSIISPTTANVSAAVNTRYFADLSGLTADRNFVLPTPAVGDQIDLHITVGDDTYELLIIGDTGITINHGAAATEWSRLFITGEVIHLVADTTSNWQITYDGRIAQKCRIRASATQPFNDTSYEKVVFSTTVHDNANIGDLTSDAISPRRAGWYTPSGGVQFENGITYNRVLADLRHNNTTIIARADISTSSIAAFPGLPVSTSYYFALGDYVQLFAYQDNAGGTQQDTADEEDNHAHLEITEELR